MTELTKILGKRCDNADFQNFLRKSWEKVTKNLRKSGEKLTTNLRKSYETPKKVSKINLRKSCEDLRNS